MRTVALVGFNGSCNSEAFNLPDDVELWSCNHAHQFNFGKMDAIIDIHLLDEILDPNFLKQFREEYIAWLREPHDFPIYMQDHFTDYPASIKYPIEDALELTKGKKYFASSFDYMMAAAILEGDVDRVEVYGFTMANGTEWQYQRDTAYYWRGRLEGAGIDVYVTPDSDLFGDRLLYGYEGAQMISRQTIEAHMTRYQEELDLNRVKCDVLKGQLIEKVAQNKRKYQEMEKLQKAEPNGNGRGQEVNEMLIVQYNRTQKEIQAMAEKLSGFEFTTAKSETAVEVCQNFIDNCDLKEVEPNLSMFERTSL